MGVPRIPAAVLLLGAAAVACGQDPFATSPAARLAPMPGVAVLTPAPVAPVIPPLMPVPPPATAPRPPCLPCPTEYQPNHVYIPEANPDWGGGCDGECRPCRRTWVSLAMFFGGSKDLGDIRRDLHCGVQGGAGYWFDDSKTLGLDASFLNINRPHQEFFFNTYINAPLTITTGDLNGRMEVMAYDKYRLDGLLGYRYLQQSEQLFVNNPGGISSDSNAFNRIHAGQLGLVGTYKYGGYFCELLGKVAVGRNAKSLSVNGLPLSDSSVAVVPELGARVGYLLGAGVYGTFGYTFLYLSDVARPGQSDTDFYLHGISIGFECRF